MFQKFYNTLELVQLSKLWQTWNFWNIFLKYILQPLKDDKAILLNLSAFFASWHFLLKDVETSQAFWNMEFFN